MKKSKKYFILIVSVVATVTMIFSQGGGYLSQKLMVENNIRDRVKDALSKLIESHKYVINVDVDLDDILDPTTLNGGISPEEPIATHSLLLFTY